MVQRPWLYFDGIYALVLLHNEFYVFVLVVLPTFERKYFSVY